MADDDYPAPKVDAVDNDTPLYDGGTIFLWLADLKKELDFDNREQREGARKLVEAAGWQLDQHGYQLIQDQVNGGDQQ